MRKIPKIKVDGGKVFINGKRAKLYKTSCRKCYVRDGIIVKLDDMGIFDCRQVNREIKKWKKITKNDKKYFPKVYAYKKSTKTYQGWVAEEKVEFKKGRISFDMHDKADHIIRQLARKYKLRDVSGIRHNCDIRSNGIPVIFDWGV